MKNNSFTLMAAALCLSANASMAQTPPVSMRIQDYPGLGNMLVRIAAAKGYCEKHGVKCELQMIPSGPLGVQALLAKSIDVAFGPPEVAINASLKGSAVKAIVSGAQLNVFVMVARNDYDAPGEGKDFKALMSSLKGKKIGVPARGSGAELQFSLLAQKAGLQPDEFTYVAVGAPNTSYGALISKQIDASMSFEPSASMCEVLKTCKTIYIGATAQEPVEIAGTNGASTDMWVTQETVDASAKAVDALIAATQEAEAFIQTPANFGEALKIAKSYFEFKMPDGDKVMEFSLRAAIPGYKVAISRAAVQQVADNMLAMKQIAAPFDAKKIIYDKAP